MIEAILAGALQGVMIAVLTVIVGVAITGAILFVRMI